MIFPIAGLMTRYTARLDTLNQPSVQPDGSTRWFDTLEVCDEDGDIVDAMTVESSQEEQPYLDALAEAGWIVVGVTITGAWRVRRC
jgi:hypothetical protein